MHFGGEIFCLDIDMCVYLYVNIFICVGTVYTYMK